MTPLPGARDLDLVPFRRSHLAAFDAAPEAVAAAGMDPALLDRLAVPGFAYTAIAGGEIVACAGLVPLYRNPRAGRAHAWMRVAAMPRWAWPAVLRACAGRLERAHAVGFRRLEADTRADWPAAQRWLERLGFTRLGLAPGWYPDGGDAVLYQRVAEKKVYRAAGGVPAETAALAPAPVRTALRAGLAAGVAV